MLTFFSPKAVDFLSALAETKISKDNPNHDEHGRFANANGGGGNTENRTGMQNPNYDSGAAKLTAGLLLSRIDFERQPVTEVMLSSLVSAQPEISYDRVSRMVENYDSKLAGEIYIVASGGKNIVWEGNHRVEAAKQLGHNTIKARIVTIVEKHQVQKMQTFKQAILAEMKISKDGGGNPNHDEHGKFSSGSGGGSTSDAHKELSGAVDAIQSEMNDHASDIDSLSGELTGAIDDYEEIAGELEPEEVYTEEADQTDWENRLDAANGSADEAYQKLRDKLEATAKAAQAHIDKLDALRLKAAF